MFSGVPRASSPHHKVCSARSSPFVRSLNVERPCGTDYCALKREVYRVLVVVSGFDGRTPRALKALFVHRVGGRRGKRRRRRRRLVVVLVAVVMGIVVVAVLVVPSHMVAPSCKKSRARCVRLLPSSLQMRLISKHTADGRQDQKVSNMWDWWCENLCTRNSAILPMDAQNNDGFSTLNLQNGYVLEETRYQNGFSMDRMV